MAHYVQNLGDEPLRYLEKPRRCLSRLVGDFDHFLEVVVRLRRYQMRTTGG
jgi:hypothetical protein